MEVLQTGPFSGLNYRHYKAILADPPWSYKSWSDKGKDRSPDGLVDQKGLVERHYATMEIDQIAALPVHQLAAKDCVLFLWVTWPTLRDAMSVIDAWGFTYKTCAFDWMKADPYRLFADDATPQMGLGKWTRSNTEPCLLATRGAPKRKDAGVRMGIISPRREHSRKPDEVHGRIQRLVPGPYLELFGRQSRPGWKVWGDQAGKFDAA